MHLAWRISAQTVDSVVDSSDLWLATPRAPLADDVQGASWRSEATSIGTAFRVSQRGVQRLYSRVSQCVLTCHFLKPLIPTCWISYLLMLLLLYHQPRLAERNHTNSFGNALIVVKRAKTCQVWDLHSEDRKRFSWQAVQAGRWRCFLGWS